VVGKNNDLTHINIICSLSDPLVAAEAYAMEDATLSEPLIIETKAGWINGKVQKTG
jgi:hypothetical protein